MEIMYHRPARGNRTPFWAGAMVVSGGTTNRRVVSQHIGAGLVLGYYNHLLKLPQSFFDRMRVGELTSRVTDAAKIRAFVGAMIVDAAANVLVVAASQRMAIVRALYRAGRAHPR